MTSRALNAMHHRVLAAMRSHGSVTPRSFRYPTIDGGDETDRLAARINELRDHGYAIETVIETTAKGKRHARYFLSGEPASGVPSTPPSGDLPREEQGDHQDGTPEPTLFDMPAAAASAYEEDKAA